MFAWYDKVLMADGTEKQVSELQSDDMITTFDAQGNLGMSRLTRVVRFSQEVRARWSQAYQDLVKMFHVSGKDFSLDISRNGFVVCVTRGVLGIKMVEDLEVTDMLLDDQGNLMHIGIITSWVNTPWIGNMYNLETDPDLGVIVNSVRCLTKAVS